MKKSPLSTWLIVASSMSTLVVTLRELSMSHPPPTSRRCFLHPTVSYLHQARAVTEKVVKRLLFYIASSVFSVPLQCTCYPNASFAVLIKELRSAKHLRAKDRAMNSVTYPQIHYPEVYILQGGYCQFFKDYPVSNI
jgi:hypothetical protein